MAPGCLATLSQEVDETVVTLETSSETFDKKPFIFTGNEIINLEEIPLPDEPAPLSQIVSLNEQLNDKQEIDSFEILEQTILKQKRLARLKNTDLRRKILLKRTFDLVCEIMDHENGFEPETDSDEEEAKTRSDSSSSSDSSSESESDEESEQNDNLNETDLNAKQNLTLVKLDDKGSDLDGLYSNLDLIEFRFEDYIEQESQETKPQAQVPVKRRASSNSDSDEDYSDDESDEYCHKDQQLVTVNPNLINLNNQLNLYNHNRKKINRKKRRILNQDQTDSCLSKKFKC